MVWVIAGRGGRGLGPSPFQAAVPVQLTTWGHIWAGVPSPDGTLLAYGEVHCADGTRCHGDLVIRETTGEGISTIVSERGHTLTPTAWSPDGRWVAFKSGDIGTANTNYGLFVVSQRGGAPRRVAPGTLTQGGFVAPDTLVLTSLESPQHWLRRVVASTGAVMDSVSLAVGRYAVVLPSPSGTRLLVWHVDGIAVDSGTCSVFDRSGHATDSLRVPSSSNAVWAGGSDAVLLSLPARRSAPEGDVGLVFVRRRIDGQGRFLPAADTLKTLAEGSGWVLGVSVDGTQLFYQLTRLGEVTLWTAIRPTARGAFARGRKVGSSTGSVTAYVSRAGGWIAWLENTTTPSGSRTQVAVEPFAGGERRVIQPAVSGFRNYAFDTRDDSLALITDAGSGRTSLTVYPLRSGAPVQRGTFDGVMEDVEWLSDGRLATAVDARRVVRVIGRKGDVKDIPIPDSLGVWMGAAPSPFGPELAVSTADMRSDMFLMMVHRLNLDDGRFTLVARADVSKYNGGLSWTTDGWLHVPFAGPGDDAVHLYRVRASGGTFEGEPPIGFESNATIFVLSRDGRRAVVRARSVSTDLWVLRAVEPK